MTIDCLTLIDISYSVGMLGEAAECNTLLSPRVPSGRLADEAMERQEFRCFACVNFSLNIEGKADGITMKAISPLTDFSFDFHDLRFERK